MQSRLVWGILASLASVAAATLAVTVGQRALIYFPHRWHPGSAANLFPTGRDIILSTEDGLKLSAWLVEPSGASRNTAVLYIPGNGGNRFGRIDLAQGLADRGFTVLLLDYRGYGSNPGSPTEDGLAADARAGLNYLSNSGFASEQIIYVGESLGTGVVATLALEQPPAGIVLRSPYTSMADMAVKMAAGLPIGGLIQDRFDTLTKAPHISAPTVVLSGDADLLVPAKQSAKVAAALGNLNKEVVIPGVGHNHHGWFGDDLVQAVDELAVRIGR